MRYSNPNHTYGTPSTRNLSRNRFSVKAAVNQFCTKMALVFSALVVGAGTVHAEDLNQRTMLNAAQLSTLLHGVVAEQLLRIVDGIASGKIKRLAPEQPVWILEIISGTILYYQGQPTFAQQPASKLVDDSGFRFGQKAVDNAKNSRDTWLSLKLGGQTYRAYCVATYPTVVCSLGTPAKQR